MKFLRIAFLSLVTVDSIHGFATAPSPRSTLASSRHATTVQAASPSGTLLSDIDLMCVMNAADLRLRDQLPSNAVSADNDEDDDDEQEESLENTLEWQIEALTDRVREADRTINEMKASIRGRHHATESEVLSLMNSIRGVLSMERMEGVGGGGGTTGGDRPLPFMTATAAAAASTTRRRLTHAMHGEIRFDDRVWKDVDLHCLHNVAHYCSEGEHEPCDAPMKESILNRLSEQRELASARITEISAVLDSLRDHHQQHRQHHEVHHHHNEEAVQSLLHSIEQSLSMQTRREDLAVVS